MTDSLAPQVNQIQVKYSQLILWPNNPRFTTRFEQEVPEEQFLALDLSGATRDKMMPTPPHSAEKKKRRSAGTEDPFEIEGLKHSIRENKWLPVDSIFVRKYKPDPNYYVVLEGNRRLVAIRSLINDPKTDPELKKRLETIEVMEVLDSGTEEDFKKKITYLLGVRHHGSLTKWTPFARARNIMERYLEVTGQTKDTFSWDALKGAKIADAVSMPTEDVKNCLRVYRVMDQVGSLPQVKKGEPKGGMKDRYYSICEEPLGSSSKELTKYIEQDPVSFLLTPESADRIANLCEFDTLPPRKSAPINVPFEWRHLDKILCDTDAAKREANLKRVELEKQRPSVVWAERAVELYKATWDKWLFKVNSILKTVSLADNFSSDQSKLTTKKLIALIEQLEEKDNH